MPGMENPNWLVGIRVYKTSQVVCPSTIIYLTKLYKKLLAILLYAYGAVERQQGSKVSVWLQVKAVEVGYGAIGRQQGVGLTTGKAAKVKN